MHVSLVVLMWLIAVAWLYKLIETAVGLGSVPNLLGPERDVAPSGAPTVTVIVPARNEAADIRACLESLLGQEYANLQIVAVDDRSTDETGAIMEALVQAHPRLEVLHIMTLPANWLGKTHAMALAARHALATHGSDYLLFTDADIIFRADAIRRSLAFAVVADADHFVLLPTMVARTHGEAVILSCLQVMSLWAVRPWRVPDPAAKRDAVGVGAFNLIRNSVYQQLGGFDAIPMEVLEDLTLGRRVKQAGFRQAVAIAPGMVSVHWAAGALGIVNNMTKNIFAVFGFRTLLLVAAASSIALSSIAPVGFLVLPEARLPVLLWAGCVAGFYVLSSRSSRLSPLYGFFFPIGALLVVYSMLRSLLITVVHGGVTWRGTFYPLAALRKHAREKQ
jgi:glycosyltransferase involved in cell wall biosynthesis